MRIDMVKLYAAALGLGALTASPRLRATHPSKVCRNKACGRVHHTGKPCCSAECFKAWKDGAA